MRTEPQGCIQLTPPLGGGIESRCWGRKSSGEEGKGRREEGKGKGQGKKGKGEKDGKGETEGKRDVKEKLKNGRGGGRTSS